MKNKELDLHGVRHSHAKQAIEDFLASTDLPVYIITGNSVKMKMAVKEVISKKGLYAYYLNPYNLGRLFITNHNI